MYKGFSRKGGPTNPNSETNRHCMLFKVPPSNPNDYVTELNETIGQNHVGEDQVSLVSIHDVTNPLGHCCSQSPNLQ